MKKLAILGTGLCVLLAFSACKSSESAYKKAYEKAKQQELAEPEVVAPVETAPVVEAPVVETPAVEAPKPVVTTPAQEEKVTVVTGDGLKDYSVVCGSFTVKANAEGLKDDLDAEGYNAVIVFNAEKARYRVVVNTFDTHAEAAQARDAFKAKYPNRKDFQESWILRRVN